MSNTVKASRTRRLCVNQTKIGPFHTKLNQFYPVSLPKLSKLESLPLLKLSLMLLLKQM